MTPLRCAGRLTGLTLIELLIALCVTGLLMAAALRLWTYSQTTTQEQAAWAQIQEHGRLALEILSSDIRHAGYLGSCALSTITNQLNLSNLSLDSDSPQRWPFDLTQHSLMGWDQGTPINLTATQDIPFAQSDAVFIAHAAQPSGALIESLNQSTLYLSQAGQLDADKNLILVGDYPHCDLFQDASSRTLTLSLTGSSGTLGNRSSQWSSSSYDPQRISLNLVRSVAYFIKEDPNNQSLPTLYRRNFSKGSATLEPLIEGVVDLQILYGLDANADGEIDQYVPASHSSLTSETGDFERWKQVRALKIYFVVVNTQLIQASSKHSVTPIALPAQSYGNKINNLTETALSRYQYDAAHSIIWIYLKAPANHYRLGQVFSTTVALRNRLP